MSPNDDVMFAYDEVMFAAAHNAADAASDSGMPILFVFRGSEKPDLENVRSGCRNGSALFRHPSAMCAGTQTQRD